MRLYLQETRFANPSLHDLVPFEHGPAPARRHGHLDVDPLQIGASKQPISEGTDEALTQNCVEPQLLHGSFDVGVPLSVGVAPASVVVALAHASIASHEIAPKTHFLVASEKLAHVDSHEGGVEPQLFATVAQTSAHVVEVSESVPLDALHARKRAMENKPRKDPSFMWDGFRTSSPFRA